MVIEIPGKESTYIITSTAMYIRNDIFVCLKKISGRFSVNISKHSEIEIKIKVNRYSSLEIHCVSGRKIQSICKILPIKLP